LCVAPAGFCDNAGVSPQASEHDLLPAGLSMTATKSLSSQGAVATWRKDAAGLGLSAAEIERMASAFERLASE